MQDKTEHGIVMYIYKWGGYVETYYLNRNNFDDYTCANFNCNFNKNFLKIYDTGNFSRNKFILNEHKSEHKKFLAH